VKVMIVSVGTPKMPGLAEAIQDYEARAGHYFRFETLDVRSERITRGSDEGRIVQKESDALLEAVPAGMEIIAIDQRGVPWSSEELAGYLETLAVQSLPGVAFLIGGPLGLSDSLRCTAKKIISLSSFTLPHEMARLVLAEQLYRAGTIRRGEPYHKSG
jgi:23S rRNA (pseudouridine1915-N3)-methyltransferase